MTATTGPSPATTASGLGVHRVSAGSMSQRTLAVIDDLFADGATPAEVAVLARVNSALLPVQVALTEAGTPHTAPLDTKVLQRTGVRTALAYLRLGLDTDQLRRDDVFETLNRPARKVKSAVAPLLERGSPWTMRQLGRVCDQLEGAHRERFADYLGDLRSLASAIADDADTAACLQVIRHRIGLGEAMDALDASRTRPEGSSHGDDLDALEQLALLQPDPAGFGDWLADRLRVPGDPAGVTLSTIHRVKGMEWPHVVVFAANQGLFPHRLADDHEEERRVFHVALTRCQRSVHVVADQERTSPFVAELHRDAPARTDGSGGPGGPVSRSGTDPATAPAGRPPADGTRPVIAADGSVHAATGLELTLRGGITGRITTLGRRHVVVCLVDDGVTTELRIPHGSSVEVDGTARILAAHQQSGTRRSGGGRDTAGGTGSGRGGDGRLAVGDVDEPTDDALFETLRSWRSGVATEHGVPPYLVFHDRHLQVIAGRKPSTVAELAGCPGVGPAKLERYADDLLRLIADHDQSSD